MGRRQRRRYQQRQAAAESRTEAEEQAEELTAEAEERHRDHDADYAAYIDSLNEDFERGEALDAIAEPPRRRPDGQSDWQPEKEKGIVWQFKDGRKNNWHDYLYCKCRWCTGFREANGIKPWAEEHPGEPDPWDEDE